MKCMLNKTEHFLNANQLNLQDLDLDNVRLLEGSKYFFYILSFIISSYSDPGDGFDVEDQGYGSMKFNIIAGVIDRSRYLN